MYGADFAYVNRDGLGGEFNGELEGKGENAGVSGGGALYDCNGYT